jgi:hypothetical protein
MKKSIFLILVVCMGLSMLSCGKKQDIEQEVGGDYRPMIYIQDRLYGDNGRGVDKLPDDAKLLGKIEIQAPQTEAMVEENFTANTDLKGCEVYGSETDKDTIYVEYKSQNAKVKYGTYVVLEYSFSEEEIEAAKETVYQYFKETWPEVTISNLRFDEELHLWNAPSNRDQYELQTEQLLILKGDADNVLTSDGKPFDEDGGKMEDWQFILKRNDKNSEWVYLSHGY